jgi:hypothetical protein
VAANEVGHKEAQNAQNQRKFFCAFGAFLWLEDFEAKL